MFEYFRDRIFKYNIFERILALCVVRLLVLIEQHCLGYPHWGTKMPASGNATEQYDDYFDPCSGAKYCNDRVCMSVCLSVWPLAYISQTACPNFTHFVRVIPYRVLVVLWWQSRNTLCTSGFVDDVTFSYNEPYGVWR